MDKLPPITSEHLRLTASAICAGLPDDELECHPAYRAAERIEQLEQDLLNQRYKHQRVCKVAGDLLKLVEFRGQEMDLQRRLSVVKQTLKEFGPEGEPS